MRIHLIRHGEVENPANTVYADIPGFVLSDQGRTQARAAGHQLRSEPPSLIISSPLDRAMETASLIAESTTSSVVADRRLTEWGLSVRWRGAAWPELPTVFPGELEAYLETPMDLPFSPEPLARVADRFAEAVEEWAGQDHDSVAFVSHEDPIHAAYLRLLNITPDDYHANKPRHCSILTLASDKPGWMSVGRWDPPQ